MGHILLGAFTVAFIIGSLYGMNYIHAYLYYSLHKKAFNFGESLSWSQYLRIRQIEARCGTGETHGYILGVTLIFVVGALFVSVMLWFIGVLAAELF